MRTTESANARSTALPHLQRTIRAAIVILLVGVAMTGCRKDEATNKYNLSTKNNVIWWMLSDIERLNPYTSTDANGAYIQNEIWESLNGSDPRTLDLIPSLAGLPEVTPDHLTYTYTMDPRAKWSDGQPVTGADVIFSFKAVMNPMVVNSQALRGYFGTLDSVYYPNGDVTKIAFHLSEPRYNADVVLGGGYVKILAKHVLDPDNLTDKMTWAELHDAGTKNPIVQEFATKFEADTIARAPRYQIGSGPYTFQGWITNDRLVLKRNPNYWGQNIKWNEAYPDTIIAKTINDFNATLTALKNKDIDIIDYIKPDQYLNQIDTVKLPFIKKNMVFWNNYTFIAWNNSKPIFSDKRVRKALTMLIDRKQIMRVVNKDLAHYNDGPVPPTQPNFDSTVKQPAFDVDAANKLLDEAGWSKRNSDGQRVMTINGKETPFKFTFLVNSGNEVRKQVLLIISEQLRKSGIEAAVQAVEWSVFLENTKSHNYDACYGAWAGNPTEDEIYQLWHSSQMKNKGSNYTCYSNPEADKLMEQIKVEFDKTKRYQMWYRLQHLMVEDQPVSFLFNQPAFIAHIDRFDNFEYFRSRPCFEPHYWAVKGANVKRTENGVPMSVGAGTAIVN